MNSKEYWLNREMEQRKHNVQDEKEYQKRIQEIYQNMIDEIEKRDQWFLWQVCQKRRNHNGRGEETSFQS